MNTSNRISRMDAMYEAAGAVLVAVQREDEAALWAAVDQFEELLAVIRSGGTAWGRFALDDSP